MLTAVIVGFKDRKNQSKTMYMMHNLECIGSRF